MSSLEELRKTVAQLRSPEGCPWDREQTHQSLAICLMEECVELLDTIDRLDYDHMLEELGDVLLQVVMHAQIGEECKRFDLEDVAREVNDKLIRRHPHVFGDLQLDSSEEVLKVWEKVKAGEKKGAEKKESGPRVFKDLPPKLPALLYARDVYKQIRRKKIDCGDVLAMDEIGSMGEELDKADVGVLLFKIAAVCYDMDIDPESELRRYANSLTENIENLHDSRKDRG